MKSKLLTTSLLASALFAGLGFAPAMAQHGSSTPGIDQSQQAISARIQQGLASGHITPSEAQVLYRRDQEIAAREAQFKANGNVNPQERQALRNDVAALSAEVERMMANRDVVRPQAGNTNGIGRMEYRISQRIDEGVRSGHITHREARRLHSRERDIERHEIAFKSDGVVTQRERRQLRNELAALRDDVERMLNNDRRNGRG
jgi:polyhydroxyalkanoate synthesis regulator phasin